MRVQNESLTLIKKMPHDIKIVYNWKKKNDVNAMSFSSLYHRYTNDEMK